MILFTFYFSVILNKIPTLWMEKMTAFWRNFVQFITFINLPIRKKFLLFEFGALFCFILIGTVCVASLSFIHYRYSQITHTALPYTKVVYALEPQLFGLEHNLPLDADDEFSSKIVTIKLSLSHMKNALAEAMSHTQKSSQKGNIFEMVIRSLSQDDEESLNMLKAILVEIDSIDELVLGIQKRKIA